MPNPEPDYDYTYDPYNYEPHIDDYDSNNFYDRYRTNNDTFMITLLQWTYYTGCIWMIGYLVYIPAGIALYSWISLVSFWSFFDMLFTSPDKFLYWIFGPYRRTLTGPFIFWTNAIISLVPGLNIISSFIFANIAAWDYTDYYLWSTNEFNWWNTISKFFYFSYFSLNQQNI